MTLIIQKLLRVGALSFVFFASTILCGQQIEWTFTSLYAEGRELNVVFGVTDKVQVGNVRPNADGQFRASLWRGSAESWTDLNPPGHESGALGAGGDQQVGGVDRHAGYWTGTAESWVDMHPSGSIGSAAYGTDGEFQVGYAYVPGFSNVRASLWRGSAESYVNLDPAGAGESIAYAVSNGQQAGKASFGGNTYASLWSGTPESWVNLNPSGHLYSAALSMARGQQAGWVAVGGYKHASIWQGTPESWTDLNPTGAQESEILGTSGEYQVGWVRVGGDHTGYGALWHGTNVTFDMGSLLPDYYYRRGALPRAIYQSGNKLYIGGQAYNLRADRLEGILWTGTIVPEPATFLALAPALLLLRRRRQP